MLFKSFRSNCAPLATFVIIAYVAALSPKSALASPVAERVQGASTERATSATGEASATTNANDKQTATVHTATDFGAAAAAATAGTGDPPPPPPPLPVDSDPRSPGDPTVGGQSIALPSGAGAVTGLGESFTSDPSTGMGMQSIPIPLIPARSALQPKLSLDYNSGGGNGAVGFGWNTGAPYIAREIDRGVPRYDDRTAYYADQDRFLFNGAELVPLGVVQGGRAPNAGSEIMPAWSNGWQYFRARAEEAYYRFFWSPDHRTWRVQAGTEGATLELGVPLGGLVDDNALETATEGDPSRIFRWNVARGYDTDGAGKPAEDAQPKPYNVVVYRYMRDGGVSYLSDIYDTPPADAPASAPLAAFAHHTRLTWEARPDVLSNYRRGWRVEQRLRLHAVDIASKTYTGAGSSRHQVRRIHLGYDAQWHVSLLTSATLEGRCDGDEGSALVPVEDGSEHLPDVTGCPMMPPTTFTYSHVTPQSPVSGAAGFEPFDSTMHDVQGSPLLSLDSSLGILLVDLDGDGLPDLLDGDSARNAGQHRVFLNGSGGQAAAFASTPKGMPITPYAFPGGGRIDGFDLSLKGANVVPLDYDGDGVLDLVYFTRLQTPVVFSPLLQGGSASWQPQAPPSDPSMAATGPDLQIVQQQPYTRVLDVNGDGLIDVVSSTGTEMLTYFALATYPGGQGAFGNGARTGAAQSSLSAEPVHACLPASNGVVSFDDPRVQLADLNADGLADIVRSKRGAFEYWPGRGDGHWGTGDLHGCAQSQFAPPILMANSPFPTVPDEEVRYGDVNGDGLSDAIAVEGTAVVVWLNVDGVSWTAPIAIPKGAFVGTAKNTTQIVDIDGSGTPDIVFGDAGHYRYIDLFGGTRPLLLIGADNGLGKTSRVDYTTSTHEMLAASTTSSPWTSNVPSVLPLVKRITVSDNLDRIQRTAHQFATSFDYANPYFDRRGPSFRGFRTVVQHDLGGADAGAQHTRTHFHVGECVDEDVPGRCARRDLENPRDALRGLASDIEVFDDANHYATTKHTTYRLRSLFSGLDGRDVRAVFVSASDTYGYEISPFAAGEQTIAIADIEREAVLGQVTTESGSLLLRSTTGRIHTRSEVDVDALGHTTARRDLGCVEGCAKPDEIITTQTIFDRVPGDASGWLYRPMEAFTTGSQTTAIRHHTRNAYDAFGQITQTSAILDGTLPLLRSHAGGKAVAPPPSGASKDGTIVLSTRTYDAFGHVVSVQGAANRCQTKSYDSAFAELPVAEIDSAGPLGSDGCGARKLVVTGIYDRGTQVATARVGYNGERGRVDLDSFGRAVRELAPDPDVLGSVSPLPSKEYFYSLPTNGRPVVGVRTRVYQGATKTDATYADSWSFTDSMGRALARISAADKSKGDGGDWIVEGVADYDSRNRVIRAYTPWFWDGDPSQYTFPKGTTPFEAREYDPFGRVTGRRATDGALVEHVVYHPLTREHWDAGDLAAGTHAGTFVTAELDGHGRTVGKIERAYAQGALQSIETRVDYLPNNEVARIVRANLGSSDAPIVRWMRFDSLGRMVLNAEPNTTLNFVADPPADVSGLHAWRYAYDDAGALVGTSDARGCGANYAYDTLGRIVAEDRSPCLDSQPAYTAPNLTTGDGTEAFHRYDEADPDLAAIQATATVDGDPLHCPKALGNWSGSAVSVSTLGAKAIKLTDGRGRMICGATRLAAPGAAATALGDRYVGRWYAKHVAYDAADRVLAVTTGARSPELAGSDGTSTLRVGYTRRSDNAYSVAGSYGTLLAARTRDAMGLPEAVTYGDIAGTNTKYVFDTRHRMAAVQTVRARPSLWSAASGPYVPNTSTTEPTLQTVLEDGQFVYDEVDNPIEIHDNRDPAQWPIGARPVSRKITYDDLNRATNVQYVYAGGSDPWQSPYAADLQATANGQTPKARPSPHVSFAKRILSESYSYDWRGNIVQSSDDAGGFYDRSLGAQTHGTANAGPYQLRAASNRAAGGDHQGDLGAKYDEAGNLVGMVVRRDGPCLPTTASCWQRFAYDWTEVGELARARRWDLSTSERATLGDPSLALPVRTPDAELHYAYAIGGARVLKTAFDSSGAQRHDAYIFETLELRHARFDTTANDFELTPATETAYLSGAGERLGRVDYAVNDVPAAQSGKQHVFLELHDHLGSTSIVIDKDTSELVERATYTAYGQAETDYRPVRWDDFREPYRFTGKEDDTELGLVYIGKRYYAPALNRWISPDPLAVHSPGATDLNVYAYVHGQVYVAVDPDGQLVWFLVVLIAVLIAMAVDASIQGVKIATHKQSDFDFVHMFVTGVLAGVAALTGIGAGALAGALFTSAETSAATAAFVVDAGADVGEGMMGAALNNAYDQIQKIHDQGGSFDAGQMFGCAAVGGVSGFLGSSTSEGLEQSGVTKVLANGGGGFVNGFTTSIGTSAVDGSIKDKTIWEHLLNGAGNGLEDGIKEALEPPPVTTETSTTVVTAPDGTQKTFIDQIPVVDDSAKMSTTPTSSDSTTIPLLNPSAAAGSGNTATSPGNASQSGGAPSSQGSSAQTPGAQPQSASPGNRSRRREPTFAF